MDEWKMFEQTGCITDYLTYVDKKEVEQTRDSREIAGDSLYGTADYIDRNNISSNFRG